MFRTTAIHDQTPAAPPIVPPLLGAAPSSNPADVELFTPHADHGTVRVRPVNLDAFPDEVKSRPQFVVWKLEPGPDGRLTKILYNPRNPQRRARTYDSPTPKRPYTDRPADTWGTFAQALAVYHRGGFAGLGYVFTADDPYVGVDLDGCRDPDTGQITAQAAAIIATIATYADVSPSGTGIKLFVRGATPLPIEDGYHKGKRLGDVEMYSERRFFTFTGKVAPGGLLALEDRTEALAAVYREYVYRPPKAPPAPRAPGDNGPPPLSATDIIRMGTSARNGSKFAQLMSGDIAGYASASEADAALLGLVKFYTWDRTTALQVLALSGLAREKHQRRPDYLDDTLDYIDFGYGEHYTGQPLDTAPSATRPRHARPPAPAPQLTPDPAPTLEPPHPADTAGIGDDQDTPPPNAPPALTSTGDGDTAEHLSDTGNARRLLRHFGEELRYCKAWGWLGWDGQRWAIDADALATRRAVDTVSRMYQEAAALEDEPRRALIKHALKSESAGALAAMLDIAQNYATAHPDQFDQDPWVLNCLNGTVDLRIGQLRPHDRADYCTKLAPVEYDPAATCPTWHAFLDRIFAGDAAMINHIQRAVGYSISGSTDEQVFFMPYGSGANGKSTFLTALNRLLGNYAQMAAASSLLVKRHDPGVNNDIARMAGARMIAALETEPGQQLATALIKTLTGQDPITARYLRKEFFEFMPVLKLWLATNHRPAIKDTTDSIWRRVRLLPFTVRIPDSEKDPTLPHKLKAEAAGILAWAVQGCLLWQQSGLQDPPAVLDATAAYRAEEDTFAAFLAECCHQGPKYGPCELKTLYTTYTRWAPENAHGRPLTRPEFTKELAQRGYPTRNGAHNKTVLDGLGLVLNEYSAPSSQEGVRVGDTPHGPEPDSPDEVKGVKSVNVNAANSDNSTSHKGDRGKNLTGLTGLTLCAYCHERPALDGGTFCEECAR